MSLFNGREGDILLFFSLSPRITFWDNVSRWETNFQDVERARKEGSFNELDLERGLESSEHVGGDFFCIFCTLDTIILRTDFNLLSALRKEDCEWINNGILVFPAINNEKFVLENWFGHRSSREKVEIKRFVNKSDEIGIIIWLSEATSTWNRSWKNEIGKQFELSQLTESKQKKKKWKKE